MLVVDPLVVQASLMLLRLLLLVLGKDVLVLLWWVWWVVVAECLGAEPVMEHVLVDLVGRSMVVTQE